MRHVIAIAAALAVLAAATGQADAKPTKLRRFAYVVGANDGGKARVKLRYAGTDADKVARLLSDLGGVKTADVIKHTPTNAAELERGFRDLSSRLRSAKRAGTRVELVFYYSGHSDEQGLLIGESRVKFKTLRERINRLPADVNIAILDSCASGAFTRSKGGSREPAFLIDESSQVTGYAFISSSSENEVAQESDAIAASFFTHYLISGLRGAADNNRDGRVTLNEAYQFAFAETVARTESTVGGAQHPAYNMHLVGTGDIVMTDLRATSASLVVGRGVRGRLFIRNAAGQLVIELNKTSPHPVALGLGPGRYDVTLKRDGKLFRAKVSLAANRKTALPASAFGSAPLESATARGGAPAPEYRREVASLSLVPQLSLGGPTTGAGPRTRTLFALNVLVGHGDSLTGLEIGGLVNIRDNDVRGAQIAGIANVTGGDQDAYSIAGVTNLTGGSHAGTSVAGVANITGGDSRGIHVGGVANYVGGDARGIHVAGVSNFSGGSHKGIQVGGVANVVQGESRGLQVAGVANVAGSVRGTQIGLVNVSDGPVKGLQIGLVNVAPEADTAIGLLNIIGNGYRTAEAWTSDTAVLSGGIKLGARKSYTILAAGLDNDKFQLGAGLGVHAPMGALYLDIDAMAFWLTDHEFRNVNLDLLAKLRVAIGYQLSRDIAVFAGPTATGALFIDLGDEVIPLDVTPVGSTDFRGDSYLFRLSPGGFAGVRVKL